MALLTSTLAGMLATAAPRLELTSSVDESSATTEWKYARVGQKVTLRARLTPSVEPRAVRWFKLEPTVGSLDNTQPSFHFASIPYQGTELVSCANQLLCPADATPTVLPRVKALPNAGTMAFQVRVQLPNGTWLESPGTEARLNGGLAPAVHRITFRSNDSYLGYLSELLNTPYIFGSAGPTGKNQTDLLMGADCADLAVYGRRRMGLAATYTSSFAIDRQAPIVATGLSRSDAGVALDDAMQPLRIGAGHIRPGDLLHFPGSRHIGVLFEDRPPLGVLDEQDLMLHTCWAPPKVEPLAETSCASFPIRVLRFR